MKNTGESKRLYAESDYGVRPETYNPAAIDAVASYVQTAFQHTELPPIGFVRHIIADPRGGLERLLARGNPDGLTNKVRRRIEQVHIPKIRSLVEAILQKASLVTDVTKTPYPGLASSSSRTIEFNPVHETPEVIRVAATLLDAIRDDVSNGSSGIDTLGMFIENLQGTDLDGLGDDMRARVMEPLCRAASGSTDFPGEKTYIAVKAYLNKALLWSSGTAITSNPGRSSFVSDASRIHHAAVFPSPENEILVQYVTDLMDPYTARTPYYDGAEHTVYMNIWYLLREVQSALVHGVSNAVSEKQGAFARDYRVGRSERMNYKPIWDRHGSEELGRSIYRAFQEPKPLFTVPLVSSELWRQDPTEPAYRRPEDIMRLLKNNPVLRVIEDSILTEEIRHAIDSARVNRMLREGGGVLPENFTPQDFLLKESSTIRANFLHDGRPTDPAETIMLVSALEELEAKLCVLAVSEDPYIMIRHLRYLNEESRIASGKQTSTVRADLTNAHRALEEQENYGHTIAAKIAAQMLGNHFGIKQSRIGFDERYDYISVNETYTRLLRLNPEELRIGTKRMMEPELEIPVDCAPFAFIDDQGRRISRES